MPGQSRTGGAVLRGDHVERARGQPRLAQQLGERDGRRLDVGTYNLYIMYMPTSGERSVSDARKDLAAVIDAARATHEPVWLSRRGRRVAAVISAADLERIQELAEDMQDILDAEEARAEMRSSAEEPVPWEQVKADLGLS